ncbi:hypothetical protein S2091_0746 [Solimicrobium silvestre]|uniref:Uncharacterized protein n=2 Tax=Solimicrobium silvestre TaxID=2099400 RepID=A0A2S9H484_9BURK|nr:hypothetical protein S2091_0746 [Solimicrobium silvestre]
MISVPEAIANKNWIGHPIYEAMGKWGKPLVTPVGDGTGLYQWGWNSKYAYNAQVGTSSSSNGVQTTYYQKQIGTAECQIVVNADSNGIITHFETRGACSDLYWGSGSATPDAESAAKGKLLVESLAKAKELNARYEMVYTKPEYAELFSEAHSDDNSYFTVGPDVVVGKLTPHQIELFSKWRGEMDSVVKDYQVFLRSTQDRADKSQADNIEFMNKATPPATEKNNRKLQNEYITYRNAKALSMYVRRTYLQ